MWKDHIVEEVRSIKERQAAKFNYDVRALLEDAMNRQLNSGHQLIYPTPGGKAQRAQGTATPRQPR